MENKQTIDNRQELMDLLSAYEPFDADNAISYDEMVKFVTNNTNVFGNENPLGHITASAWILNKDHSMVLLTHHKKLNKWLQLGGHTEPDEYIRESAMREALEESGLKQLKLIEDYIFDIDVHLIPERGLVKQHLHYDVRFLFVVNDDRAFIVSDESNALKWIPLEALSTFTVEPSIMRMVEKTILKICG